MKQNNKLPKILLWDLETNLNVLTAFQLLNKNSPLPYEGILQERYIICAGWKWYGKGNKVHTLSVADFPKEFKKDVNDDRALVEFLHELLSQADAVVAHYGDAFDIRFLNSRLAYHKLPPLPPIIQIDTWKIARSKFNFNSNRLDYLGKFLGVGRKIRTEGGLWLECLKGNKEAILKMKKYCGGDIRLLEAVFERLKPYVPEKINYKLFNPKANCGHCGSSKIEYRGYSYTKSSKYKRFMCQECGAWGRNTIKEK